MSKQYYFLAGFFRSGNTVLSSILNQNPEIYSSPISGLIEHLWQSHLVLENFQTSTVSKEDSARSRRLLSNMIETYYEDINKNIIFDRSKVWTNPYNVWMIKEYITKNPKIVFTTRPIIDMMASYMAISKNQIIHEMSNSDFSKDEKLEINDNLADFLFSPHSNFGKQLIWAFQSIDNPDNTGMIHVVKYEDLLNTPQETMNSIYDFLEIESFQHNFKNIRKIEEYNESAAGLPKDLHKIRRVLGKGDVKVEDYLTPRSIEKYKDVRYF